MMMTSRFASPVRVERFPPFSEYPSVLEVVF